MTTAATRRFVPDDDAAIVPASRNSQTDVAMTRAAQEVQAAVIMARKFPRNQEEAHSRIMRDCQRPGLAEGALYAYPKGGQTVEGPSIRLAECLARNWGNLDFGIIELEQRNGESTMQAYCWDLETNTRQTKIFTVAHERTSGKGDGKKTVKLDDARDIYETNANQGARRLRACILGIIPGDVVEDAVAQCNKTMAGKSTAPLVDRIRQMVGAFLELGVTAAMIEARLGHHLNATGETELATLRKVFRSLKDGMASPEQFFGAAPGVSLNDRLKAAEAPPVEVPKAPPAPPVEAKDPPHAEPSGEQPPLEEGTLDRLERLAVLMSDLSGKPVQACAAKMESYCKVMHKTTLDRLTTQQIIALEAAIKDGLKPA